MSSSGGEREGSWFLYCCGELGSWWTRADAVGHAGRCSGAALCAESSGVGVAVDGVAVRSGLSRF
jgi:hypothetical protein